MPAAGADAEAQRQLDAGEVGGPWLAADTMSCDDVIDPRELRNTLLRALWLAEDRRRQPPELARLEICR